MWRQISCKVSGDGSTAAKTLLSAWLDNVSSSRVREMAWKEETLPHNVMGVGLVGINDAVWDRELEYFPSAAIRGGEVKGCGVAAEDQGQGL